MDVVSPEELGRKLNEDGVCGDGITETSTDPNKISNITHEVCDVMRIAMVEYDYGTLGRCSVEAILVYGRARVLEEVRTNGWGDR